MVSLDEKQKFLLHKTNVVDDSANPRWKSYILPSDSIESNYILFEVFDSQGFDETPTELIGSVKVSYLFYYF